MTWGEKYPQDIIWFPQGTYIIGTFNTSRATNNYTVSISGKDKMCLLNGEMGGSLAAQTDFAGIDDWDEETNSYIYTQVPIYEILKEAIHTYAKEPYHNIIINDLDDCGIELLEYRGDQPLYLLYDVEKGQFTNFTDNGDTECLLDEATTTLAELANAGGAYNQRVELNSTQEIEPSNITFVNDVTKTIYQVARIEYGQTVGYRNTELVYAGELVASVGESITSVLDKIKTMLGEFEYFYDVDGRFIFQRKRTYTQSTWNNITKVGDDEYAENSAYSSAFTYKFEDGTLLTAVQNNPALNNLRNDFSVWGERESISGAKVPIHYRYAIDDKPMRYQTHGSDTESSVIYYTKEYKESIASELSKWSDGETSTFPTYALQYPAPTGMTQPVQTKDGWTAGWWDIRDWREYYIKCYGVEPRGTLKWYSRNNAEGCVPLKSLNEYLTANNIDQTITSNDDTWLIQISENGAVSSPHSAGSFSLDKFNTCTYYESYIDDNGLLHTEKIQPTITKVFYSPYYGCNDTHTFLSLTTYNPNLRYYFYNPNFYTSTTTIVNGPAAELRKDEYYINGTEDEEKSESYVEADWRELIYQMARDYYKYHLEEDFNSVIASKNQAYYGDGETGYEQYYTDIYGFWRQLYDTNPQADYVAFNKANVIIENNMFENNDADGNIIPLYLKNGYYKVISKLQARLTPVDQLYAIKQVNGHYELHPWKDAVEITLFESSENKGTFYYASADGTYNLITETGKAYLSREEIFTCNNNKYYRVLDPAQSTLIDSGIYQFCIYQEIDEPIAVQDLSTEKILYLNTSLSKYYATIQASPLDKDGKVKTGEPIEVEYGIDYYGRQYNEYVDLDEDDERKFWNKSVYEDPSSLNFWFDFLDSDGELGQYSVPVVGDRSKAVNDTKVTSIYFREVPNLIFTTYKQYLADNSPTKSGYTTVFMSNNLEGMFSISAQGYSAQDKIDELVYQHTYCTESVTITAIPIYYLQPNTRIFVRNDDSNINGEYIVSKITLPLAYNGTMSITATKAPERIN